MLQLKDNLRGHEFPCSVIGLGEQPADVGLVGIPERKSAIKGIQMSPHNTTQGVNNWRRRGTSGRDSLYDAC